MCDTQFSLNDISSSSGATSGSKALNKPRHERKSSWDNIDLSARYKSEEDEEGSVTEATANSSGELRCAEGAFDSSVTSWDCIDLSARYRMEEERLGGGGHHPLNSSWDDDGADLSARYKVERILEALTPKEEEEADTENIVLVAKLGE